MLPGSCCDLTPDPPTVAVGLPLGMHKAWMESDTNTCPCAHIRARAGLSSYVGARTAGQVDYPNEAVDMAFVKVHRNYRDYVRASREAMACTNTLRRSGIEDNHAYRNHTLDVRSFSGTPTSINLFHILEARRCKRILQRHARCSTTPELDKVDIVYDMLSTID